METFEGYVSLSWLLTVTSYLRPLQSNILICDSELPRALLGDFGLKTTLFDQFSLTGESIHWTAPELLTTDDTTYQPTVASDVYALAMAIHEVSIVPPSVL